MNEYQDQTVRMLLAAVAAAKCPPEVLADRLMELGVPYAKALEAIEPPTDRDSLLRAILANPADDMSRLVFADWLEEHGESERAEFIRIQCELATIKCTCSDNGTRIDSGPYGYGPRSIDPCERCNKYAFRRREQELLARHEKKRDKLT